MAFDTKLHIEGHPREQEGIKIYSCDFGFHQEIDHKGIPNSRVYGGVINLRLRNENDYDLMEWMLMPVANKNGKIVFSSDNADDPIFQTIKFYDAALVNFHQSYYVESEITVDLTISCRKMDISGSSFNNMWLNRV